MSTRNVGVGEAEFGRRDRDAKPLIYADDMDLGAPELLIILVLVLLLFGGAKLPSLARSLGEAKREFEKATHRRDDTDPSSDQGDGGTDDVG